jgi:predicted ATP-grasp superfamily ATP-dependent carboligase
MVLSQPLAEGESYGSVVPMRALILDQGQDRAALTAARALMRDGWTVGSGVPVEHGLVSRSRAVARCHLVPSEAAGSAAILAAANRAIAEGGYEVVFSCDDSTVFGLSLLRDQLDAMVPYGDHSSLVRSSDKLQLIREAERCGLAVPRTEPAGELELESFGANTPVVVKPRLTFLDGVNGHVRASIAANASEAREHIREMRAAGAEPVIQECVAGRLMAFIAVTDRDARIVARVQQVADRIWPAAVGVSARAHTVAVDPVLAAKVGALLEGLGWFGLAQLQFILGEDGVPRLVDFNGRFYGSLALAVAAGPNLPAIWGSLAVDRPIGRVPEAQPGVLYQWLAGDLQAGLHATAGYRRAVAALGSLATAPRATHSVWRASDPWPAITHFSSKLAARVSPS